MTSSAPWTRLDSPALETYWQQVSDANRGRQDEELALVCYAGMPSWFNAFIDRYQRRSFLDLAGGQRFAGARVLDLGTGTGRWARWYASRGAEVTGVDLEPLRLELARLQDPGNTYLQMPIDALDFPDASFDLVNCVTVLQHVPAAAKRRALREARRMLSAGGRFLLMEVIDETDDAPHVFPWSQDHWHRELDAAGFRVDRVVGNEYTPLLRLIKSALRRWKGGANRAAIDAFKTGWSERGAFDPVLLALRVAVLLSYPLEEACRLLPPAAARINGWLCRAVV